MEYFKINTWVEYYVNISNVTMKESTQARKIQVVTLKFFLKGGMIGNNTEKNLQDRALQHVVTYTVVKCGQ